MTDGQLGFGVGYNARIEVAPELDMTNITRVAVILFESYIFQYKLLCTIQKMLTLADSNGN